MFHVLHLLKMAEPLLSNDALIANDDTSNNKLLESNEFGLSPRNLQIHVDGSLNQPSIHLQETRDVSFITKLYLLLWKNYKSQFYRRKKPYICKLTFPIFIMVILGLIARSMHSQYINKFIAHTKHIL